MLLIDLRAAQVRKLERVQRKKEKPVKLERKSENEKEEALSEDKIEEAKPSVKKAEKLQPKGNVLYLS